MRKQNDEITVKSLLDIFIPKLWLAVIVAVVFAFVFGVYSSAKKDTYTSSGLYMFSKTNYNNEEMQTGLTAAEVEAMQAMIANGKVIIDTTKFARSVYTGLVKKSSSDPSAKTAEGEQRSILAQNIFFGDKIHVAYAVDATVEEAASGSISVSYKWTWGGNEKIENATLLDPTVEDNLFVAEKPIYKQATDEEGNPLVDENGAPVFTTEIIGHEEIKYPVFISEGRVFSENIAKDLRSMMNVSLSSDDTTCYYLSVTSPSAELAKDVATIAGDELVKIYEDNTKYAIEIIQLDEPSVPEAPNSKNVVRNAVIGFAGGFLLSLLVIFVLSRFDVVIRSREKLEESFDLPILGVIPRVEPSDIQHGNSKKT